MRIFIKIKEFDTCARSLLYLKMCSFRQSDKKYLKAEFSALRLKLRYVVLNGMQFKFIH